MIKEAIEDYKRYKADKEVNNRPVEVLDRGSGTFVEKRWQDVKCGEILIVNKDEFFPADILFLTAENEEGTCYIETMGLDGETNLKIKKALDDTKDFRKDTLQHFQATIECEPPNSRLYQFTGNLIVTDASGQNRKVPINPAAVLLRGCSLRNTNRVFGAVIYAGMEDGQKPCASFALHMMYGAQICCRMKIDRPPGLQLNIHALHAGHQTKIFKNSTQAPSKRSTVERIVDKIIIFMFTLLFCMCLCGCIYFARWTRDRFPKNWYLGPFKIETQYNPEKPVVVGITNFITSFILYGRS